MREGATTASNAVLTAIVALLMSIYRFPDGESRGVYTKLVMGRSNSREMGKGFGFVLSLLC